MPGNLARFLSLAELNPEELEKIRYWKAQTVGEILFHHWDANLIKTIPLRDVSGAVLLHLSGSFMPFLLK